MASSFADFRAQVRSGAFRGPTAGIRALDGLLQANMVILPASLADAFGEYCAANAQACPLVGKLPVGEAVVRDAALADDLPDVRTDLPKYRVYRRGALVDEPHEVTALWRDDLVTFLLGCSFSFEAALAAAGVPLRHVEQGRNVPMFITNVPTSAVAPFSTPLVVSMRPMPAAVVDVARRVSDQFQDAHGAPIHAGDPAAIGIADVGKPDFGEPVELHDGDVCVFWKCGVTAIMAAKSASSDILITHAPGCMFVATKKA